MGDNTTMNITTGYMRSKKKKITVLVIIMFFSLFILPSHAQDKKLRDVKKFYQNHCVKCHGADGSATGEDGKRLKGEDFTDQKWLSDTKDEEMINTIMKGKFFGMAMPAFKDKLTQEEAQLVVTEIIRKSKKGKIIAP
jgi:mono/diheme cytochrome c family protein